MEVKVDRSVFSEEVGWVARVISARPISPILQGMHISTTDEGMLELSATDQSASSMTTMEADIIAPGAVVVSGKFFTLIAGQLPQQPVHLKLEGTELVVTCGRFHSAFPTFLIAEYPSIPEQPNEIGTFAGEEFSDAITQVAFAAAKDETLPVLAGIKVQCSETQLTLYATDRYRLAVKRIPWKGDVCDPFLPRARSLVEMVKPASSNPVVLSLNPTSSLFGVTTGSRRSTMTLLDGASYPNVERIIPNDHTIKVETDTGELVDAVKRACLTLERSNQPLRLKFSDGEIILTANSANAKASEILSAKIEGDPIEVAFNPNYLAEGLSALAGEVARFQFNESMKMVQLDSPEDESYQHILVPVRLET